ncbi:MAG TPA: hypothetical protein VK426_08235 [Methanobacterium sp.]|nr:hypothetical protein [Methanobacterium sp.]
MYNDNIKTLKIVIIAAVVIGIIAASAYVLYGFSLFWATFAAGITIGLLLIFIVLLLILLIYLWIRMLLLKREIKRLEIKLEQVNMELSRCRSRQKISDREE